MLICLDRVDLHCACAVLAIPGTGAQCRYDRILVLPALSPSACQLLQVAFPPGCIQEQGNNSGLQCTGLHTQSQSLRHPTSRRPLVCSRCAFSACLSRMSMLDPLLPTRSPAGEACSQNVSWLCSGGVHVRNDIITIIIIIVIIVAVLTNRVGLLFKLTVGLDMLDVNLFHFHIARRTFSSITQARPDCNGSRRKIGNERMPSLLQKWRMTQSAMTISMILIWLKQFSPSSDSLALWRACSYNGH